MTKQYIPSDEHAQQEKLIACDKAIKGATRYAELLKTADKAILKEQYSKGFDHLRDAADELGKVTAPYAACSKGCSHCCNIPVVISWHEAKRIGKAIGREPVEIPLQEHRELRAAPNKRCTFLAGDLCSIYADRPIVCRGHVSIALTPDPCDVSTPTEGIPYVNQWRITWLSVAAAIGTHGDRHGLLTDYFPSP